MYDPRTLHSQEVMARVVEAFGETVFDTVINRTVRFPETTVAGEPITTWAPSSAGAKAYRAAGPRGDRSVTGAPPARSVGIFRFRLHRRPAHSAPVRPSCSGPPARPRATAASRPNRVPARQDPAAASTTRRSPSTSPTRSSWRWNTPGWRCAPKHGLVVDRGRLVREAVAVLLADFEPATARSRCWSRWAVGSDGGDHRGMTVHHSGDQTPRHARCRRRQPAEDGKFTGAG